MRPAALLLALALALVCRPGIADEDADFGVAPVATLRPAQYAAPTPRTVPGARTVSTAQLRAWLQQSAEGPPLLFDVLGGDGHDSLPGAIWLPGAGRGQSLGDAVQERLAQVLQAATQGDRKRPLVFFCQGPLCWLSYNAALRAVALGYRDVYWYRGGIEAWTAGGGAVAAPRLGWQRPAD